jgi:3-hydroxyacyl-CoA dehydrogenase/enoyl-CoA hydratase/3-hydroxybutyryl-CoA epimerase
MAFTHFTLEVDSDGLALVTWNSPGRTMNLLDVAVKDELSAIVDQVTADPAIKGVVITSGKDSFCAGADLTVLEAMSRGYAESWRHRERPRRTNTFFDESRKDVGAVSAHRNLRQAVGRCDQRDGGWRRL